MPDHVKAPPMVLGSIARLIDDKPVGELLDKRSCRHTFEMLLRSDLIIVGANLPFDLLVMAVDFAQRGIDLMPLIFEKFRRNEVYDILTGEALHAVGMGTLGKHPINGSKARNADNQPTGRYNLFNVVLYNLGRETKINDEYRLRYHEFDDKPLSSLPFAAAQYPVDDAVDTLEAALAQVGWLVRPEKAPNGGGRFQAENVHDHPRQIRAHWAMHLGAAWGFSTDGKAVKDLEERCVKSREGELPRWKDLGILRDVKKEGEWTVGQDIARTRELVAKAYGCDTSCPVCNGGECPACFGVGRVPGARVGKTKICPVCKGDRPPCGACNKTGIRFGDVPLPYTLCDDPDNGCGEVGPHLCPGKVKKPSATVCVVCHNENPIACRRCGPWRGGVQYGRDALGESGDDELMAYAHWDGEAKILKTYVPFLKKGTEVPLTLFPNVLLANGRSSYGDVVQQLPRRGGVRECIIARPGRMLSSTDYGQLELYTHAQSCLWLMPDVECVLANALNTGVEVHVKLAAEMAGISYDKGLGLHKAKGPWFKPFRQAAKPGNYGFPGLMGALRLVLQQRKTGPDTPCAGAPDWIEDEDGNHIPGYRGLRFCVLVRGAERCGIEKVTEWNHKPTPPTCRACVEVAEDLRNAWFVAWPENKDYFRLVGQGLDYCDYIIQHVSKRKRGGVWITNAANGYFSGLAADGAKDAIDQVSYECYAVPESPLFGSRLITFQHDELVCSHPVDKAAEAAERVGEIMVDCMRKMIPDVAKTLVAEPALMARWYKDAEPKRDENGRLVPWEPKKKIAAHG